MINFIMCLISQRTSLKRPVVGKPHFPDLDLGVKPGKGRAGCLAQAYFSLRIAGAEIIREARAEGRQIIVLAGRPFTMDSEITHAADS